MKFGLAFAALAALFPAIAHAQSFPRERPVTLVVPFAPGGGTDSISRELARHLQERLGAAVVGDNRRGAGGAIGAAHVGGGKPHRHTLLFLTSTFVTMAATDRKLPYQVLQGLTPRAM